MRTTQRKRFVNGSRSLISNEKLVAIHAAMVRCRMIRQRAELLHQRGRLKSDICCLLGREASSVAFAIDLQPKDALSLPDKDLTPGLVNAGHLGNLFRALAEKSEDTLDRSVHLNNLNVVVASNAVAQIAGVRELGLAAKRGKKGNIVLAFLAGMPESRSNWDAAMRFGGSKGLPVVFVANGAWRATDEPGAQDALVNGIPAIVVDAADAVAVYRVASEAIARARQGRGPTLVECIEMPDAENLPTRVGGIHLQSSYRPSNDPELAMKDYLRQRGLWSEENYRQCVSDIERELDLATRFPND